MPTRKPADTDGFASLGLEPRLLEVLASLGYEEPTPIQRAAIPPLLEGRDVLGLAATGTGKTAAFALPMLQRLSGERARGVRGLVLVPTRELAMQVSEALHRYGRGTHLHVLPVYGGQWIGQQLKALGRGVDIVVATPGRALDLIGRGSLRVDAVRTAVLDEADEMLDLGFADDIEAILDGTPAEKQTALFSATMPRRIAELAARRLRDPVSLTLQAERPARGALPRVRQVAYVVARAQKATALSRILDVEAPAAALVFCRTREAVDELSEALEAHGYRVAALHGGLSQGQRDRVLGRFRQSALDLLIATDVAARGLDIPHISHVINFDLPNSAEGYVHRIGRTGRAGREGVAISLAQPREERLLRQIEKFTRQRIEMATVPTVADLRARRLELTRASLREALVAGQLDGFRSLAESLAEEFDLIDVAAAALKLVHEADGQRTETTTDAHAAGASVHEHGPRERATGRARARGTAGRWFGCTSGRGGRQGCGRGISWGRWSREPGSIPGLWGPSRSATGSRWWRSAATRSTRPSPGCAGRRCAARKWRSAATAETSPWPGRASAARGLDLHLAAQVDRNAVDRAVRHARCGRWR